MTPPRFQPNDRVSLHLWDRRNPMDRPFGECSVISVRQACCGSDYMVLTRTLDGGRTIELDQNWVSPLVEI